MRDPVKSKEQLLTENHCHQRAGRSGGHTTEARGSEERDRNNGESRARIMDCTEGQADWRVGKAEKLKPVAER